MKKTLSTIAVTKETLIALRKQAEKDKVTFAWPSVPGAADYVKWLLENRIKGSK